MKVLIYNSGGGLGDSIQLFDIINSICEKFGSQNTYYLSAHENHFNYKLKDFNIELINLETSIKYFGFRLWHYFSTKKILKKNLIGEFDLIIDLQSKLRNTLILRQFSHKNFYSSTMNFLFCTKKCDYKSTKFDQKMIISNLEKLLNLKIPYKKYNINSIDKSYFDEAKRLLPNSNYIGFSVTQGNEYRKKSWPLKNFINLSKNILKKNKIPVFFIEKKQIDLINEIKSEVKSAIFPELKSSFSGPTLITALATRLEKTISIDNGIMHMISLSNTPMIVLFGPTNSKKFAPNIDNIKILDSKEMYNSDDIKKITKDDVSKFL